MTQRKKKQQPEKNNEPVKFVFCPECGNEQADMGRNVSCEACGYGPMPNEVDDG